MPQAKQRKPPKDKPIYFTVKTMVEPGTGNRIGCLMPNSWMDRQLMRERHYRANDVVRVTLTLPRNTKFHRLVHQLGTLVKNNIEGFEHLSSHEAIKRLQRESGVFCEVSHIDAEPVIHAILLASKAVLGEAPTKMLAAVLPEIKKIDLLEPMSIAFDSLDESEFRQLWEGICNALIANYWPTLTIDKITEMAELLPKREHA